MYHFCQTTNFGGVLSFWNALYVNWLCAYHRLNSSFWQLPVSFNSGDCKFSIIALWLKLFRCRRQFIFLSDISFLQKRAPNSDERHLYWYFLINTDGVLPFATVSLKLTLFERAISSQLFFFIIVDLSVWPIYDSSEVFVRLQQWVTSHRSTAYLRHVISKQLWVGFFFTSWADIPC